ncbi:hypothetical protein EDD15DRAFT_2375808 [Pisolithus albus]|nr:hypothetical protein EDD15DRAFT_2375808 [Pisolithus albus]
MSYQIINVNETAKVVPLFWGDCAGKGKPADWFTEFQLSLPATWSKTMKIDQFSLQLAAGSQADEWFVDLPAREKTDMATLKVAFLKRWPPTWRPKWTRTPQQQECIRALKLEEEEIGKWIETAEGGDYGHILWATKVMRLAMSMGDVEGKLIKYVVEEAPAILWNELEDKYDDWEEFVEAVRKVKVKKVLRNKEAKRGEQELWDKVAELYQQISQMVICHATQNYQTKMAWHPTIEGTTMAYWSQQTRPGITPPQTAKSPVAPPCILLTQTQFLEKASTLPQHANTEMGRRLYSMKVT